MEEENRRHALLFAHYNYSTDETARLEFMANAYRIRKEHEITTDFFDEISTDIDFALEEDLDDMEEEDFEDGDDEAEAENMDVGDADDGEADGNDGADDIAD